MSRLVLPAIPAVPAWLARCLWQCLLLGALLALVLPDGSPALSRWLLAAPAASLLMLYRHALWAAWRGILVPAPRRRRPRPGATQARRTGYGQRGVRRQPIRAA